MMWNKGIVQFKAVFLVLVLLIIMAGTTSAAEFYLRAATTTVTMPDNRVVTMWGFALDVDNDFATVDGTVTAPGPVLEVPSADTTLTIHLKNDLPEAISLVIPGQIADTVPVWNDGSIGPRPSPTARVRSFTHETDAAGGTAIYSFSNVEPGTYLYHSGTHPAVQVQMGLYGAVKKDAAPNQAYESPSTAYTKEGILVLSEVDPDLHLAVTLGTYGTPAYPSTIDYAPRYFLYNGFADPADPDLQAIFPPIVVGDRILVRILNAGLITRVPLMQGADGTLLAQDGNLLPYPKQQYHLTLTAAKTMDVLITPTAPGTVAIYDRRGYVTPGVAGGLSAPIDAAAGGGVVGGGGGGGGCFLSTVLF